jgi:hypothetical protein
MEESKQKDQALQQGLHSAKHLDHPLAQSNHSDLEGASLQLLSLPILNRFLCLTFETYEL